MWGGGSRQSSAVVVVTMHDYDLAMKSIGTADLKAHLSEHLQSVRRGETITVLDRREPVARIVPILDVEGELVVRPAKGSLQDLPVPPPVRGGGDVVEDLLRDRQERL